LVIALAATSACGGGASKRMADGKRWTTRNLEVATVGSYCYEGSCRMYGRLFTWDAAKRACASLGDGWRLPTDDEWHQLSDRYGGGKAAYESLMLGGNSGFGALLGGGRDEGGQYARLEAHGFYWTATEDSQGTAVFYNFAKGQLALFRQDKGEKGRAFAVRCVEE
jgi:uncharacterized protein (TIGR02145 family)